MNCEICGATNIERVYYDVHGDVFGCEDCVIERSAEDVEEAMWDRDDDAYDSWKDEMQLEGQP